MIWSGILIFYRSFLRNLADFEDTLGVTKTTSFASGIIGDKTTKEDIKSFLKHQKQKTLIFQKQDQIR